LRTARVWLHERVPIPRREQALNQSLEAVYPSAIFVLADARARPTGSPE